MYDWINNFFLFGFFVSRCWITTWLKLQRRLLMMKISERRRGKGDRNRMGWLRVWEIYIETCRYWCMLVVNTFHLSVFLTKALLPCLKWFCTTIEFLILDDNSQECDHITTFRISLQNVNLQLNGIKHTSKYMMSRPLEMYTGSLNHDNYGS